MHFGQISLRFHFITTHLMNLKPHIIVLLLIATAVSCKKKKDSSESSTNTISGTLTGKWKMVKKAYDENYNLKIDADEIEIPSSAFSASVMLNEDNTGITIMTFTGQPDDTSLFTWARPSTAEITSKTTKGGPTYVAKFVHIDKLTESELILVDTAKLGSKWELNWTFFSR